MGSETDRSARDWLAVVVSPARAPTTRNPCSHTYSLRRPNFSRQPRFLCTRVQNTKQLPPYTASISVNHTMAGEIETEGPDYTRLHITPLTPALLSTFLPPSVLPIARNISYHSIETFPERAYGFVELPSMEASKLQKKLNGSILKGTKIRIEAARPQKLPVPDDDPEPEKPKKERTKKSKKRKRDDETIPAAEIGERSVKRGWTTPSSKSDKKGDKKDKKAKSKYTEGKECLFKTVVPPNKTELKDGKKKRKNTREEIVHEFAKTTKHASFLRGSKIDGKSKTAREFVEGKGWVDEDGNLIEEVTRRQKPATEKDTVSVQKPSEDDSSDESSVEVEMVNADEHEINDAASHSAKDDTSEASSSEGESDAEIIGKDTQEAPMSSTESSSEEESESTDSSDSESESTDAEEASTQDAKEATKSVDDGPKHLGSRPTSSSGLTITIPPPSILTTPASASKSVHPLEALYKRPASTPSSKGTLGAPSLMFPRFPSSATIKTETRMELSSTTKFHSLLSPRKNSNSGVKGRQLPLLTPRIRISGSCGLLMMRVIMSRMTMTGKAHPPQRIRAKVLPERVKREMGKAKRLRVTFRNGSMSIEGTRIERGKREERLLRKSQDRGRIESERIEQHDKCFCLH